MNLDRKTLAYYRRPLDAPSMLVIVCWLALWLVWPLRGVQPARVRIPGSMRIRCVDVGSEDSYRRPTVFLNGVTGFKPADAGFDEMLGAARRSRARPLEDDASIRGMSKSSELSPASAAEAVMGEYEPVWRESPVFLSAGEQGEVLVARCSEALRQAGLQFEETLDAGLVNDKTWQVILYVEGDGAGHVAHVFLLQGSGDAETDAHLVKAVYRAEMREDAPAVGGRVTISYDCQ